MKNRYERRNIILLFRFEDKRRRDRTHVYYTRVIYRFDCIELDNIVTESKDSNWIEIYYRSHKNRGISLWTICRNEGFTNNPRVKDDLSGTASSLRTCHGLLSTLEEQSSSVILDSTLQFDHRNLKLWAGLTTKWSPLTSKWANDRDSYYHRSWGSSVTSSQIWRSI